MNVRDLIEALEGIDPKAQIYTGPNLDPVDAIEEILSNEPYIVLIPAERANV